MKEKVFEGEWPLRSSATEHPREVGKRITCWVWRDGGPEGAHGVEGVTAQMECAEEQTILLCLI